MAGCTQASSRCFTLYTNYDLLFFPAAARPCAFPPLIETRPATLPLPAPTGQVYLNGKQLPVRDFKSYIDLFLGPKQAPDAIPRVFEKVGERWEVAVAASDDGFTQVSRPAPSHGCPRHPLLVVHGRSARCALEEMLGQPSCRGGRLPAAPAQPCLPAPRAPTEPFAYIRALLLTLLFPSSSSPVCSHPSMHTFLFTRFHSPPLLPTLSLGLLRQLDQHVQGRHARQPRRRPGAGREREGHCCGNGGADGCYVLCKGVHELLCMAGFPEIDQGLH